MKRATVLALIMFFILIGTASAFEVKLFEGTFIRESDKPFTESKVFNASGDESNPILKLFSGGLNGIKKESVSSATVELNGTTVFKASDFNKNVTILESPVSLQEGENIINVNLNGEPGSYVTLMVTYDAKFEATIGPEGGYFSFQINSGLISEIKVEVPEGAVDSETHFTITTRNDMKNREDDSLILGLKEEGNERNLPDNLKLVDIPIEISPSGLVFLVPLRITYAYRDENNDGYVDNLNIPESSLTIFTCNSDGKLEKLRILEHDLDNNVITGEVDHFSPFLFAGEYRQFKKWTDYGYSECYFYDEAGRLSEIQVDEHGDGQIDRYEIYEYKEFPIYENGENGELVWLRDEVKLWRYSTAYSDRTQIEWYWECLYDDTGKIKLELCYSRDTNFLPIRSIVTYAYDESGNVVIYSYSRVLPDGSVMGTYACWITYDENNREISYLRYDISCGWARSELFYDSYGNLIKFTNDYLDNGWDDWYVIYYYDPFGNIIKSEFYDSKSNELESTTYFEWEEIN